MAIFRGTGGSGTSTSLGQLDEITQQALIATTKANEASQSATSALTAFDNFDDTYLGSKTSAPTADNDGDSLALGSLYFDTTLDVLRVYTGTGWSSVTSSGQFLPLTGGTLTGDLSLSNNSFNNFQIDAGNF
jgi:hypothetical protein